jgi:hypothetical protein
MKNILLLTNIYPNNDPDYGGTSVCHFFTQEWVKLGYNVRVIHFDSLFPRPYYWVGKMFNSVLQARTGCVIYTKTPRLPKKYNVDDVPVMFVPLRKIIPHKQFSDKTMQKAMEYVVYELETEKFVPDIIVGHFILPQLQFLHLFKQKYPRATSCMVLHSSKEMKAVYPNNWQEYMASVDIWGFRSVAFKEKFESVYGVQPREFLCYSGIPEKYLDCPKKEFKKEIKKFAFVGSLYELKRVNDTINALYIAFPNKDFSFDIVGSGAEESNLKSLVKKLGLKDQVIFHGQQKRDDAQKIMGKADCFVMVSTHEAFGLVYVEAMARGLITIATRGQGIDGIIIDGENGYLCESRNPQALAQVIKRIRSLSVEELNKISEAAIKTAENLTNKKVAENYIKAISQ